MKKHLPPLAAYLVFTLSCLLVPKIFAEEEINEKAARYHEILKKRPGGGYLFDRFYNAWLDTGSLEGLKDFLTTQAESTDRNTADALILGFFHAKQGNDEKALTVFTEALKLDPKNSAAWFEKAKISSRTLNFEGAIQDLNEALQGNPKADTALEIAKLKGRLLVRSGKNEEAIQVWKQLLEEHPGDEELHEDLVELQIDEGLYEEAIATSGTLVAKTKDPYQKVLRQLRTGDIFQRIGKRDEAIKTYQESLTQTGSDTWIEKEILSQIEQVFRKEDDITGLSKYLDGVIKSDPQRTALAQRQAEVLMELKETGAATKLFGDLLAKTPGNRPLRESYIDLLRKADEFARAVAQMEELIKQNPEDTELLISLANLQHQAGQSDPALTTLSRYLSKSDEAEYAYLRVARLQETFQKQDAAEQSYRDLLTKFPESVNARETFASFLHRIDKKEEAIAIWKKLGTEGDRDQAVRMARSLTSRQENEAAFEILEARYAKLQNDPVFLSQLCTVAIRLKKYDEAVDWAVRRVQLVDQPVDMEPAVKDAATIITNSKQAVSFTAQLDKKDPRSPQDNCLLAELMEKEGNYEKVNLILSEKSDLILSQKIRILRLREDWKAAADTTRILLAKSEGRKSAFLREMVALYRRAQLPDEARKWIPQWKTVSPGSIEPWVVESSMLREEGKADQATEILRVAARKFQEDVDIRNELASSYVEAGKSDDARRIYLNLFENADQLADKIRWIGQIAAIARNDGKMDQLIEDFRERRRNNRQSVAPLLALAEIHRSNSEYEERRQALLEASRLKPKDVNFILEIARIEESEGDWEAALKSLNRARTIDDSPKIQERIAAIHLRNGDEEEGYRIVNDLGGKTTDADAFLKLADAIASRRDWGRLNTFLSSRIDEFGSDYRIHYLQGITLEEMGENQAAVDSYLQVLSIDKELTTKKIKPQTKRNPYLQSAPPGYEKYISYLNSNYQAYQYRSGRNSYTYSPSGIRMSSGTIGLPATIELAHGYALSHLSQLRGLIDESERATLQDAIQNAAGQDAAILCQLDFDRSQYSLNINPELLDKYPDNLPLHLLWVSRIQQNGSGEMKYIEHCFELFEKDYPSYAVQVGLAAKKVDPEAGEALFDKSMALLSGITEPDMTSLQSIASILQSKTNQGLELSEAHESMLRKKLIELYPKASKVNPQYGAWIFWNIASAMASGDDPKTYVEFLEKKIADHRKENKPTVNPYSRHTNNNNLIQAFPFPPMDLPKYPYEVLLLLQDPNNRRINFGGTEPDADHYPEFFKIANDPILKLLLGLRAQLERDQLEPIVEAIKKDETVDPLAATQLLAGWYAREGEYKQVVEILEQSRFRPMSRKLRSSFDAALVHAATELDLADEKNKVLVEAGKGAVLRLAYSRLLPNQRNELISAMTTLGMEAAAEKEEKKVATAPLSNRSTSYSQSSSQSRDRIQKLIDSGKRESALRETVNQIKSLSLQALSGQDNNWRYYSRNLLRSVEKHQMADELLTTFAKESTKNSSKLQEYAAAALILNDEKRAIELFQKVVAAQPRATGARTILASLLLKNGSEDALPLVEKMDGIEVSKLATWVLSDLSNGSTKPFDLECKTIESLIPLLAKIDDRSAMSWTWPPRAIERLARSRSNDSTSLGGLYQTPEEREKAFPEPTSPADKTKAESREKSNQRRWDIHDRFVAEMKKSPYFAAISFECQHAGAVSRGLDFNAEAEARNTILQLADLKVIPQVYRHNIHRMTIPSPAELLVIGAWKKENRDLIDKQLLGELKGKRNGAAYSRHLQNLAEVYFCEPDQILTKYQSRFPQNSRTGIGLFDEESHLFVRLSEQRKLPPELLRDFALKRARSGKLSGNNYANQDQNRIIAKKLFEKSPEEFRAFLKEMTEIYCGTREQRVKSTNQNVIEQYMYFLREIAEQDGLMFATLDFIDEEELRSEYPPNNLQSSRIYSSLESFAEAFDDSPILAEKPEDFRVYPLASSSSDRQSIFEQVLYGATRYGSTSARKDIVDHLKQKSGFGAELLAALASKNLDEACEVAKAYIDDLQKLPERRQTQIGALLQRRLGKATPFKSDPADPLVAWVNETSGNSSTEKLEKFLAAKKPRDIGVDGTYELRSHTARLMNSVEYTDPEKAKAVFYHAIKIGESAYRNNGYTPNFPEELLQQYTNDSNRSMERLAVVLELLCATEPVRLDHPGYDNRYRIADTLTSYFKESLGENDNQYQDALTATFTELHNRVGDDPLKRFVIGIELREFIDDLSNGKVEEEAVTWINANLEGKPFSGLVHQLAMSARMFCTSLNPTHRKNFAALSDQSSFKPYFEELLFDKETYPRHLRLGLAHHLYQYNPNQWSDTLVKETARLAFESLSDDKDFVPHDTLTHIVNQFSRLEDDDEWTEIAALLPEAWKRRTRFASASNHPLKYSIDSDTGSAIFELFARMGDEQSLNALNTKYSSYLNETGTLVSLVRHGLDDRAIALLKRNKGGLTNDYDFSAVYSSELEARIPAFLEKIEDKPLRYYGEVVLAHAPDPRLTPGETRKRPYPRDLRIGELASRFGSSGLEGSLQTSALAMMINYDTALKHLDKVLAETFKKANFDRIASISDYTQIREAAKHSLKYADYQLKQGNAEPAITMWKAFSKEGKSQYGRYVLRDFFNQINFYGPARSRKEKEVTAQLSLLRAVIEHSNHELINQVYRMPSYYVILSSVTGYDEAEIAWMKSIPETKQVYMTDTARKRGGYNSGLKSLFNSSECKITAEEKLATIQRINQHPWFQETIPFNDSFLRRIISNELVPFQQLEPHFKEFMTAFDRKGFAALDIASCYADQNRWDEALAYCQVSRDFAPKPAGRIQRVMLREADYLWESGKKADAIERIDQIDIHTLPVNSGRAYRDTCKKLGVTPKQKPPKKKPS